MKSPWKAERVLLRPITPADFDAIWELASDEGIVRMKGTWPFPPDEAFTRARLGNENATSGRVSAIELSGTVIGSVAITGGILGYALRRDWWGQGYATEAVRAKAEQVFTRTDNAQIKAGVWVDNPASSRVLNKVGFVEEGRSKGFCTGRNAEVDQIDYVLTRPAWEAGR